MENMMTVKRFRQIYKLKVTANQKRIDLVKNKTIKSVTRTEIEQLPNEPVTQNISNLCNFFLHTQCNKSGINFRALFFLQVLTFAIFSEMQKS